MTAPLPKNIGDNLFLDKNILDQKVAEALV